MNKKELGLAAERLAEQYLTEKGYRIVRRNWRCRSGEIDLIVLDGNALVFVEVRSRSGVTRFGTAAESVTERKQRQVRATAEVYLYRERQTERTVRFDVVTVLFQPGGSVKEIVHWPNAF
ncbi:MULTISPECIES: YraN family protein [unclassified Paenibacillus]|uniref:YraN family protein n=1 Tax=unclassified Paenibacillus TaxID=185978 RepID=UPI001C0F5494|nr:MULTISPECIES: YraN family protein [unclassified Paenibacillus]MBU5441747.1 YraN family protein [Paenibacillus sp. MSJ-34]CAH0119792.1 hypothetical protein PAE9249_02300 [Paenibacillus sp. CECT 9249]